MELTKQLLDTIFESYTIESIDIPTKYISIVYDKVSIETPKLERLETARRECAIKTYIIGSENNSTTIIIYY